MTSSRSFLTKPFAHIVLAIAILALVGCATRAERLYNPTAQIEYRYSQAGPYAVTRTELSVQGDQARYAAYLPDGEERPRAMVILQNGTNEGIDTYDAIARHLASWGMIVLGNYDTQMGSGEAAIISLRHVGHWTTLPGHPLYRRVDMNRIAMAGSSQGAVGTINAHTRFPEGRMLRALAIHATPSREAIDFFGLDLNYDASAITAPVFIMTGTEDAFISSVELSQSIFNGLRGSALRVLGVAANADHIEFADDGGYMRGYLTAWLAFRLLNDPVAAQAFIGPAEITTNPGWTLARVAH